MIGSHLTEFYGKPVIAYDHGKPFNVATTAPRLSLDWEAYEKDKKWADLLDEFFMAQDATETTHLIVGAAEGFEGDMVSSMTLGTLIENKDKLSKLEALFIADITYEESELSWINAGDFSKLWENFPNLKALGLRGYPGELGNIVMPKLESLTIQCSGMSKNNAKQIQAADLPNLTRLELWVGTEDYGGETDVQDWEPLLSGKLFPKLTYLGLKNCSFADELAKAAANAPILDRLKTLDMSMGTLGDDGGVALYTSSKVRALDLLDLHHHFMSDWMVGRFNGVDLPAPSKAKAPQQTPPALETVPQQPQPQHGFFGRLFGKKAAPTPLPVSTPAPAPISEPEETPVSNVDYGSVPLHSGTFGPKVNLEEQNEDDDGWRYVSAGE